MKTKTIVGIIEWISASIGGALALLGVFNLLLYWIILVLMYISGGILIYLDWKEEQEKKKRKIECRKKLKRLTQNLDITIESMWQSKEERTFTFRIGIENSSNLKLESSRGNLSFFMGGSATDERLIGEKDLKRGRKGQTIEDAPPKGKGFVCFTIPVTIRDLHYHTYRVSLYIEFITKYGVCRKSEDFDINSSNRHLLPALRDKNPISIMRDSDGEIKWLNSPK